MQFQKKTSLGKSGIVVKIIIKVTAIFLVLFLLIVLINKINFPHPLKKIEKIISNEKFKVVK